MPRRTFIGIVTMNQAAAEEAADIMKKALPDYNVEFFKMPSGAWNVGAQTLSKDYELNEFVVEMESVSAIISGVLPECGKPVLFQIEM